MILLKSPEEIQPSTSWIVGVDFGTSFTNIYVNRNGIAEPLQLENLHLKVTEIPRDTRITVLFEYFIPENFIPADKPLPLSSVLTTRGKTSASQGKERPIFDGRIYIPSYGRFGTRPPWIETDLKWENFSLNQLFLKHLALHISAIAAKNRVAEIQWSLSFPSAFSRSDKNKYGRTWQNLTQELQASTGINHICPEIDDLDKFRTESLAIAQYFADYEGHDLVNTTCIDVGGGTSDISIWEENRLVHQCSVQLAGRDLFSQFLGLNLKFMSKILSEGKVSEFSGSKDGLFDLNLNIWLRSNGDYWLRNKRNLMEENPEFQGLIKLIAIGMAGLYYYIGILLKVLYEEGKYNRKEITPVYIGGNGSQLLNWLAEGGRFDRHSEVNLLLSRMLSKGSGFEDTEEVTRLTNNPKHEVACGLVLNESKLEGLTRKVKDLPIAGEAYEVNGIPISYSSRLDFEDEVEDFKVPQLVQLSKFLSDFNLALKELEIEGIQPMESYKVGKVLDRGSNQNDKLWRDTNRELTNVLLKIKGKSDNIRVEPPFILGLKALLRVLGKEWAEKWQK
ncbi:hypothetical protein [Limnofasciculus baicalensis]|uniref:hypothetical protein n=1 Tax=Limnofasciculus baicalensis TaxID=3064906 RepID=UPI0020A807C1|nr:hypothetical protein [Limnofasciculus baicalensis]